MVGQWAGPGVAACASRPGGTPPGSSPVVEVPYLEERALLLLLADRRMFEPVAVERSLEGGRQLREAVSVTLGRVGDPRGRPILAALLLDPEAAVRRAPAFALGQLGEPEASAVLLRAATDPNRETGRLAVKAPLAGPDTAGSQFFLTLSPQPHLDGVFTAFGQVVEGVEVLQQIAPGERIEKGREAF